MAKIKLGDSDINTSGELPAVGEKLKDFSLVAQDLTDKGLSDYKGKKKVLNIFPSIDTGICAASVRAFNKAAGSKDDVVVLNISRDLPFAFKRFCGAEGIENAISLSTFRSSFQKDYGLEISESKMSGLCSRVVIVADADNKVLYTEQVPSIGQEPNYDAALAAL